MPNSFARIFGAIRRSYVFATLAVCLTIVALPGAAAADVDKRVALVIGNGDYKTAPRLDNPPIDARAVAASLKRLGFQVIEGYDLTMAQMRGSVVMMPLTSVQISIAPACSPPPTSAAV